MNAVTFPHSRWQCCKKPIINASGYGSKVGTLEGKRKVEFSVPSSNQKDLRVHTKGGSEILIYFISNKIDFNENVHFNKINTIPNIF